LGKCHLFFLNKQVDCSGRGLSKAILFDLPIGNLQRTLSRNHGEKRT
jgi:hypothetical protein